MELVERIPLDQLSPAKLWRALDDETKQAAARSLYADADSRREADAAVAAAIRFRPTAVRQLPVERRIRYLTKNVVADEPLASSLLMALHLGERAPLLGAFLDHLEIPHDGGLIDDSYDLTPPDAARLRGAVEATRGKFPEDQVEVYLLSLLALDDETWGALNEVLGSAD